MTEVGTLGCENGQRRNNQNPKTKRRRKKSFLNFYIRVRGFSMFFYDLLICIVDLSVRLESCSKRYRTDCFFLQSGL